MQMAGRLWLESQACPPPSCWLVCEHTPSLLHPRPLIASLFTAHLASKACCEGHLSQEILPHMASPTWSLPPRNSVPFEALSAYRCVCMHMFTFLPCTGSVPSYTAAIGHTCLLSIVLTYVQSIKLEREHQTQEPLRALDARPCTKFLASYFIFPSTPCHAKAAIAEAAALLCSRRARQCSDQDRAKGKHREESSLPCMGPGFSQKDTTFLPSLCKLPGSPFQPSPL